MLKTIENTAADVAASAKLDTRVKPVVRVLNATLDEDPASPQSIVLHGRIDPSTLRFLKADQEYQRPLGNRSDIWEAYKAGTIVPNIEVGVRGLNFTSHGNDFEIHDPAYIIDGWQRVGTALALMEQVPDTSIRIFASIHFGTDAIWERHRFTELNKNVKKVSPNLHLRNMRDSNEAVLTLYGLSFNTPNFPLYKKVSWSQNMLRDHLISALVLAKAGIHLHRHKTTIHGGSVESTAEALNRAAMSVSLGNFRKNLMTFFSTVEECWGLRNIEFKRAAPQVKGIFLYTLGAVMSRHLDFWDEHGRFLTINADQKRKLSSFPIHDPQVVALSAMGGKDNQLLAQYLINHLNKGRSANRLRSRYDVVQS
jgi:hypothetical protein